MHLLLIDGNKYYNLFVIRPLLFLATHLSASSSIRVIVFFTFDDFYILLIK
jgi:hypothetical protein